MQVLVARDYVQDHRGDDKAIWKKISKNEYRRCAVVESYESMKHVLVERIVRTNSEEHQILQAIFEEVDIAINQHRFTKTFSLRKLPDLYRFVLEFVKSLLASQQSQDKDKVRQSSLFVLLTEDISVNSCCFSS